MHPNRNIWHTNGWLSFTMTVCGTREGYRAGGVESGGRAPLGSFVLLFFSTFERQRAEEGSSAELQSTRTPLQSTKWFAFFALHTRRFLLRCLLYKTTPWGKYGKCQNVPCFPLAKRLERCYPPSRRPPCYTLPVLCYLGVLHRNSVDLLYTTMYYSKKLMCLFGSTKFKKGPPDDIVESISGTTQRTVRRRWRTRSSSRLDAISREQNLSVFCFYAAGNKKNTGNVCAVRRARR